VALTAFHLQIAGIVILVAVAIAAVWWIVRAAMGWHSGRALYWLNETRDDDVADEDDDPDDDTGTNAP
jgi:uncharacterized membrane protein